MLQLYSKKTATACFSKQRRWYFLIALFIYFVHLPSYSGTACLPYSYSALTFNLQPSVLSAYGYSGGTSDRILTQSSATAGLSADCTTSTSAYLLFTKILCGASCIYVPTGNASSSTGSTVTITFLEGENSATRALFYNNNNVSNSPLFKIENVITINCPNGKLLVSFDTNLQGFRVDNINDANCNGAYTVSYRVSIYQTTAPTPVAGTPTYTAKLGSPIQLGVGLYDSNARLNYRSGVISNSENIQLNYVSTKCLLTTPNTVSLPTQTAYELMSLTNIKSTNFSLSLSGCTTSNYSKISIFWVFTNPDPLDDSILLNSNTNNTNNANNVGVKIFNSDNQAFVRHRVSMPVPLPGITSNGISAIKHSVTMVKSKSVTNYTDIRPGAFNTSATLYVEYQ